MQEYKNKVEAILFTTGRFMDVEEIAKLCNIGSIGLVKEALKDLIEDYGKREGALEIFGENDKFKLNIRKQYNYLTTKLLTDSELDRPTQETLAIIAYKHPMLQSDVIKVRGSGAYDHIKALRQHEFITAEKHGRTRLLKLAPKFFDYFDVVQDKLQEKFNEVEEKVGIVEEVQEVLPEQKEKPEEEPSGNGEELKNEEEPPEEDSEQLKEEEDEERI
jgi:segregation and condensation protein B